MVGADCSDIAWPMDAITNLFGGATFDKKYVEAALMVSLLSVWVLVGLFFYLNQYTKRNYFTIWTAAWLFYALWLTLSITSAADTVGTLPFFLKQCCVGISAVFLLWGSLQFLGLPVRQTLFGLLIAPDRTAFRRSSTVARPPGAEPPHSNRVAAGVQWNSASCQVCAMPPRS